MNRNRNILANCNSWEDFENQAEKQPNTTLKGKLFLDLVKYYFEINPIYSTKINKIWSCDDIPQNILDELSLPRQDQGIDIIAKTNEEEYWAIQCKYRKAANATITKTDLSTFTQHSYVRSNRISQCFLCMSIDQINDEIQDYYGSKIIFLFGDVWKSLSIDFFDNLRRTISGKKIQYEVFTPRVDQLAAADKAYEEFVLKEKSRGQLIYPCGSGKSLIGFLIAEKLNAQSILILAPSLALINQLISTWIKQALAYKWKIEYQVVCSDITVDQEQDDLSQNISQSYIGVSTDSEHIVNWLTKNNEQSSNKRLLVFATYQSGKVISEAMKKINFKFELGIFDEAHKTCGLNSKHFNLLLFDKNAPIKKRVFMTATPRIYYGNRDDILCMDNIEQYGKVFHRMSFKEAINLGILSDYELITIEITEEIMKKIITTNSKIIIEEKNYEAQVLASAIALLKAQDVLGVKKTISFHGSVSRAKTFKEILDSSLFGGKLNKLLTLHVSGKMPICLRNRHVSDFRDATRSILTNSRCLTEGIDIPNVDSILFADPKKSKVDIIQAMGRALRKCDNKSIGYIVIPIYIENGELLNKQKAYKEILGTILQALATSDERIVEFFQMVLTENSIGNLGSLPIKLSMQDIDGIPINNFDFIKSISLDIWKRIRGINVTEENILKWIDLYKDKHGKYPNTTSLEVSEDIPRVNWKTVDAWLRLGLCGLSGGSSLANLLKDRRDVKHPLEKNNLKIDQILKLAKQHFDRTGKWPNQYSKEIIDFPGETWSALNAALVRGMRGLPGGSSLAEILSEKYGARNKQKLQNYELEKIKNWALAHYERTGKPPWHLSGSIPEAPGETWSAVATAISKGGRGLPGGITLGQFLSNELEIRVQHNIPDFNFEQIKIWIKAFNQCTGEWPNSNSGSIPEAPCETWLKVDTALRTGGRGLSVKSSLSKFISQNFNIRTKGDLPNFCLEQIKTWIKVFNQRTGKWPNRHSGAITEAPGETWSAIDNALFKGSRGLSGGSSLAKLLEINFNVVRGKQVFCS